MLATMARRICGNKDGNTGGRMEAFPELAVDPVALHGELVASTSRMVKRAGHLRVLGAAAPG